MQISLHDIFTCKGREEVNLFLYCIFHNLQLSVFNPKMKEKKKPISTNIFPSHGGTDFSKNYNFHIICILSVSLFFYFFY